jgi:hypothetical protein
MTDDNKVVKLRQPQVTPKAGVVVDDPISPKSLLNMTDVEQDMFLQQLRDRRLRAAEMIKQAQLAKHHATSIASSIKVERKAEQAQRQFIKASKALERLEELLYDLRALTLQHTDIDITKV